MISPVTVEKYILLISNTLGRFKKRGPHLFNFRCPICEDSQEDTRKARGYIYYRGGRYSFYCHNCHASKSFEKFLDEISPALYLEYKKEILTEGGFSPTVHTPSPPLQSLDRPDYSVGLTPILDLPNHHHAIRYLRNRRIPQLRWGEFFYTDNFSAWNERYSENKLYLSPNDLRRLVIPIRSTDSRMVGVTSRGLDGGEKRYVLVQFEPDYPRVVGVDRVDFNKRYYVLEGPLDSIFIDNSLAMLSASLPTDIVKYSFPRSNAVLIFDNEPRNDEILRLMSYSISMGFRVVCWPEHIREKDVNEMVMGGLHPSEVSRIIDSSIKSGLEAKLYVASWRKC